MKQFTQQFAVDFSPQASYNLFSQKKSPLDDIASAGHTNGIGVANGRR